jgi:DNA-directed RNA polymerase subunit E'/Rpb7
MSKLNPLSLKSLIKPSKNENISLTQKSKRSSNASTSISKSKDLSESDSINSTDIDSTQIKLNEIIYPCKDEILSTRVILHPYQMNNDLYINLKKNLVDKIEGKCTKDGFIIKVYKILEYIDGIIEPENFTGSAVYFVKYLAKICIALNETSIVAKITSYIPNANFALAEFGSIIKIIFTKNERDLNTQNFLIGNDKSLIHIHTQKKITSGDYVVIQLKSVKFYQNDTMIKCMGYLDNIASVEEIAKFTFNDENKSKDSVLKSSEGQTTIYFNDDNEIEETNIEESLTNQNPKSNFNDI